VKRVLLKLLKKLFKVKTQGLSNSQLISLFSSKFVALSPTILDAGPDCLLFHNKLIQYMNSSPVQIFLSTLDAVDEESRYMFLLAQVIAQQTPAVAKTVASNFASSPVMQPEKISSEHSVPSSVANQYKSYFESIFHLLNNSPSSEINQEFPNDEEVDDDDPTYFNSIPEYPVLGARLQIHSETAHYYAHQLLLAYSISSFHSEDPFDIYLQQLKSADTVALGTPIVISQMSSSSLISRMVYFYQDSENIDHFANSLSLSYLGESNSNQLKIFQQLKDISFLTSEGPLGGHRMVLLARLPSSVHEKFCLNDLNAFRCEISYLENSASPLNLLRQFFEVVYTGQLPLNPDPSLRKFLSWAHLSYHR